MNLSIPLRGIQSAQQAFNSSANSLLQASAGSASNTEDSVDFSAAAVGLLATQVSFLANVKVAAVEENATRTTFSLLA